MRSYAKNPRKITDQQLQELESFLRELGDLSGIVHDLNSDQIIGGNQRSKVFDINKCEIVIEHKMKRPDSQGTAGLGYVIWKGKRYSYRQVRWTPKQCEKANIVANKAGGDWDEELLEQFFKDKDLVNWGFTDEEILNLFGKPEKTKVDAEPRFDESNKLLKYWKVKPGDIWSLGKHRLICGDCTDAGTVARVMRREKARMVFTDPPWNVAIGKDSNPRHRQREGMQNDDMSDEEYSSFVSAFVSSFVSVCNGDVYCKVSSEYMDVVGGIFRNQKYHWSATIIWVKDIFVLGRSKYHRRYEPIWYGWHEKSRSSFCDVRDLDDVWEIARPRVSDEHPTMMPVELPIKAITNSSAAGDIIYDPFNGSGTTIIACENLERKCRAIEISPVYVAVALQRFEDATGTTPKRLEIGK